MAESKPARGRRKKTTGSRPKTASRKRKSAPKKTAARAKPAARKKAVRGKKKAAKSRVAPKKAVRGGKKATTSRAASKKTASTPRKKATVRRTSAGKPTVAAHSAVPNAIGLQVHHMDYTSHAMDAVRRFYTETLGFTESSITGEHLMVRTGQSSSLGFMPPMPGPPDQWQPPREPTLYFMVEDVDRVYGELSARGVEFDQAPQDAFWGHRVAMLRDPEGRTVCIAHVIKE